jgi:hypothetical protein
MTSQQLRDRLKSLEAETILIRDHWGDESRPVTPELMQRSRNWVARYLQWLEDWAAHWAEVDRAAADLPPSLRID